MTITSTVLYLNNYTFEYLHKQRVVVIKSTYTYSLCCQSFSKYSPLEHFGGETSHCITYTFYYQTFNMYYRYCYFCYRAILHCFDQLKWQRCNRYSDKTI